MPKYNWKCRTCSEIMETESKILERKVPEVCPKCQGSDIESILFPSPHIGEKIKGKM